MKLSATPVEYRQPPPLLGQHTATILHDLLGMASADIDSLRTAKIIYQAPSMPPDSL
jgi:formyl-CoA transferase